MNNQQTQFLCHYASKEAKRDYNKKYYQKNKQYWVDWRKLNQESTGKKTSFPIEDYLVNKPADDRANAAYKDAQKSSRLSPEEIRRRQEHIDEAYEVGAFNSATKKNWALAEGQKEIARINNWRMQMQSGVEDANRLAAKRRAKNTPYAKVSLEDLTNERNMSKIAKATRSVKRMIDSAVNSYKTSWKIGAADLISLGKEIKRAWDNA